MNNTEPFAIPNRWGTIRPQFIIALVAILVLLGAISGYIEISQSRKDVMTLLKKEAETVAEALSVSAANAVQAYGEIQAYIEIHLFNTAILLNHLEKENSLTRTGYEALMRENEIAGAFYINNYSKRINFVYPESSGPDFEASVLTGFTNPVFEDQFDRTSGFIADRQGKTYLGVALRGSAQGAWLLFANPEVLVELRKRIGIGRLIQDIGANEEFAYIVLQDEKGIISASKNVGSMPRLDSDPFSAASIATGELRTRTTQFNFQEIFEVVKPLQVGEQVLGLIRIGLHMDAANQAMTRTIQRAVAVVFGFVVIGVLLFNFLMTNQNFTLMTEAYTQIKTYTGNILENMADAVVAVDQNRRITLFNLAAERLFGQPSTYALGKSCHEIIGEQTSLLDEALDSGKEIHDLEVDYRLNEKNVTLSVTTRLLHDNDGEVDSAVAVIKDLSEKKAFEDRLRRQDKLTAMGELASGVAHEIRNPLNAISIIAQRFANEFQPVENAGEYRDLANSVVLASRQVNSIIERFLAFTRPSELNFQSCTLNEVLIQAMQLVESQAKLSDIAINGVFDETIEMVIDPGQMEQVFVNLLQNAIQATPGDGKINVLLNRNLNEAVVSITDTGAGISPEYLNRIFDLYFTTKTNGTGMGLSISHRIVSEHNGRIDVKSRTGYGATFTITLPIRKA